MATAAGLTAPMAVSTPATPNMIHGIAPTRPPTARIASFTSQSTVPLICAIANRYVIPTRTTKMSPGKTPKISSAFMPAASVPTRKAAANASRPMFTDIPMAIAKTAASTSMEMTSLDKNFTPPASSS